MPTRFFCAAAAAAAAAVVFAHLFYSISATTVGVTYNPSAPNLPPPERVISTLMALRISAVQLIEPTPAAVRAFSYTNISLLISVPNRLIPTFAANRSSADLWVRSFVLPFYPRTRISLISAGSDAITSVSITDPTVDTSTVLLPALRNLRRSLIDLGIRTIPVSTTFSFIDVMTTAFPPSAAEFQEPIGSLIIRPLLQFLDESNSSFLINLYPYNVYRINSEIPVAFALFQEHPFNFRDDVITGVRYRNLFDMMVDAVIAAMAVSGQENIPVIVAETGWPSDSESQAGGNYAEMYLKGLVAHLRSGIGTPLSKDGAAEAYIYELFDDEGGTNSTEEAKGKTAAAMSRGSGAGAGQRWGILYPNMTLKYDLPFSGSLRALSLGSKRLLELSLVSFVLFLFTV
ncbi:glucan endo-1,3-beta-glucosidase 13-like [Andrographis paniculata]|uniref:glucan endo-1,3-beta-glucosidase 13-like n=1 Tax=Andrographis paniculata TaxID=175694 RepID=UPI0021E7ECD1|nr:glucan endo-1,3-beta-glucosidase 13-like [Andrographis paniculata]